MSLEMRCTQHPHYQGERLPRIREDGTRCEDCLMLHMMTVGPVWASLGEHRERPAVQETVIEEADVDMEIHLAEPIPDERPRFFQPSTWGL